MSLFGGESDQTSLPEPTIPYAEEWTVMEKLSKEKSVVGIYISGHPLDDYKNELKYFCNAQLNILQNQAQLIDRDLSFGGIVTSVTHRVSKNGKGWGMFSVEDYSDSFEFRMFGEEYLRLKHFLVLNSFLHIRIKISKGWKEGETRMRFQSISMLQDVLENQAKKITLRFDIHEINKDLIQKLAEFIKTYKGKKELDFMIYEMKEQLKLHMPSRKYKIAITNDLLQVLNENEWNFILK
jgi:DNA polymerase-3 subunit alpha